MYIHVTASLLIVSCGVITEGGCSLPGCMQPTVRLMNSVCIGCWPANYKNLKQIDNT